MTVGHVKMIGKQAYLLQLLNQCEDQFRLERTVPPCDDDVDVSARLLPPAVGTASLNIMQALNAHQLLQFVLDTFDNLGGLISRNALFEFLQIFQSDALVLIETVLLTL